MKKKRTILKAILIPLATVLLAVIVFVVSELYIPTAGVSKERKFKQSYSDVNKQALKANPDFVNTPLTEIAMLGSHDALSYNINFSSKDNSGQEDIGMMETMGKVAKGLAVRLSRAQYHDIYTQLNQGVRYIDMRITCVDNTYYTSHNFISHKLEDSMKDIIRFLDENPGEFLLLDFQHVYPDNSKWDDLSNYLSTVKEGGKNIYDFVKYDTSIDPSVLTYGQATDNGTVSSCMFIQDDDLPFSQDNPYKEYFKKRAIDSLWHDKPTTEEILTEMNKHASYLKENPFIGYRINQAQTTPSTSNIANILFKWSLIKMASEHNPKLLKSIDIQEMLKLMPIYMVDYTTSTKKNFNKNINEEILKYNSSLHF